MPARCDRMLTRLQSARQSPRQLNRHSGTASDARVCACALIEGSGDVASGEDAESSGSRLRSATAGAIIVVTATVAFAPPGVHLC